MNEFNWKDGKLYHSYNGELLAVVEAENVDDYREFVPDAPQAPHVYPGE